MKRALLAAARFLLPRKMKRALKRLYDPNQLLPHPDQLDVGCAVTHSRGHAAKPEDAAQLRDRVTAQPVSLILVTYNALPYTRLCLATLPEDLDLIIVDNASTDGTVEFLRGLTNAHVIFNERNEGFPAAVNRAVAIARGDVIVLLNNDTIVPGGTLPRLVRHARENEIGLVVAVTNFSGNESRVDAHYATLAELREFADERAAKFAGQRFDIATAAMYCVAMRREVVDRVGLLDDRFTIGTFEDDDYSERVRRAGYRVVCAADAFVHHYGGATFKALTQREYFDLEARNRALFEEKWKK